MLEELKSNISRLIALYESQRQECLHLKAELGESRAETQTCKNKIIELERQIDNLRLTQAFCAPAGGDIEAREKVDKLIREIDKCISLLEK